MGKAQKSSDSETQSMFYSQRERHYIHILASRNKSLIYTAPNEIGRVSSIVKKGTYGGAAIVYFKAVS
jgi:hypothetical protein